MLRILAPRTWLLGVSLAAIQAILPLSAQEPTGWPTFAVAYRKAVPAHGIVGSSVAFIEKGRLTARAHVGLRDQAQGLPVNEDTIFHWASITKTFTAIGILQLRDRGLLSLEDPILKYVPELRKVHNPFGPMGSVTIRHLLSHASGFQPGTWPWGEGAKWQPFEPPAWEQLVGMMPYTKLAFAPGTRYGYSNPAYVYLGRVIEDLVQEPFETYIDKEILRPLGMTRSFFDRTPSFLLQDRSHSYYVDDTGLQEARFDFDTGITVANGGLNAPITDLANYLGLLQGSEDKVQQARYDRILRRESLEEMWRPVVPVSPGVHMGLGFFLEDHRGRAFVAHSGGQNGLISHFYVDRTTRKGLIIAFNTQTQSDKHGEARNTRALDAAMREAMLTHLFQ